MALVCKQVNQAGEQLGWVVKVPCPCRFHIYDSRWRFVNNDLTKPTFRESYLATHPVPDAPDYRCHSYVTDGFVEYCGDCSHSLNGQRHPLIDMPDAPGGCA